MRVAGVSVCGLCVATVLCVRASLPVPACGQDKKAAMAISAEALGQEYDTNAKATHKKYDGQLLEVTGKVKQAIQTVGTPFISLEGSKKALYSIQCETKDKQPWARFSPGQKVKITGAYNAGVAGPELKNCDVVALEPNPAVTLTAEALAKSFAANMASANKKFQNKTVIVTGTITATQFLAGSGFTDITLRGSGKTAVICRLHNSLQDLGKSLKAGQMITLSGPFSFVDGNNVRLDMSFPVTKEGRK